MMPNLIKISACAIAATFATACNNDIFVEPIPDIADSITLRGFNDSQSLKIHRKGLKDVYFFDSFSWQFYETYYDHDGNVIYGNPDIDNVSRISYVTQLLAVEARLKGDEIEIVVFDNAYLRDITLGLSLDYGHTVQTVRVNIKPGKPLEITQFGHIIENTVNGTKTERGTPITFENNSEHTLTMDIHPYQDVKSRLVLTPDEDDYWSDGSIGMVSPPAYVGGEWSIFYADEIEATIGKATSFQSSYVNTDAVTYVEVPPYTSGRVEVYVTYATYETRYSCIVQIPGTDFGWMVGGLYKLMQPIGYNIETTLQDL